MAPKLDRDRHIKYWKRCASILPEPYTTSDSNRMSFGFFIVAALDLLDALETTVTPSERSSWIEWIYTCQVPHTGGFRGFTGTMMGAQRSVHNWDWDGANLANTYFALATLVLLSDDLRRIQRRECLEWVRRLQRDNGSFGECLGEDGVVVGGDDMRLCMCAMGIMTILRVDREKREGSGFDREGLLRYISNCQVRIVLS
jgi:geranylgeranyl transferase type-1 subunit beta